MAGRRPRLILPSTSKPAYRVPSMADVAATRGSSGYNLVSTFSGCGGSCLGFEMAGFSVLWANEFVDAARETYALNHQDVFLDGRDVRKVDASEILAETGDLSPSLLPLSRRRERRARR